MRPTARELWAAASGSMPSAKFLALYEQLVAPKTREELLIEATANMTDEQRRTFQNCAAPAFPMGAQVFVAGGNPTKATPMPGVTEEVFQNGECMWDCDALGVPCPNRCLHWMKQDARRIGCTYCAAEAAAAKAAVAKSKAAPSSSVVPVDMTVARAFLRSVGWVDSEPNFNNAALALVAFVKTQAAAPFTRPEQEKKT